MGFGQSEDQRTASEPTAAQFASLIEKVIHLANRVDEITREQGARLTDAERCIKGLAEELAKSNERIDTIIADRAKHMQKLERQQEEIIEATQEAEKAFLGRIEQLKELVLASSKVNANLKQQLRKEE